MHRGGSFSPESEFTHKCQKYLHPFDWYAKPVQLTYNQRKAQATVPGSICTLISACILLFFTLTNLIKYLVPEYFVYFQY